MHSIRCCNENITDAPRALHRVNGQASRGLRDKSGHLLHGDWNGLPGGNVVTVLGGVGELASARSGAAVSMGTRTVGVLLTEATSGLYAAIVVVDFFAGPLQLELRSINVDHIEVCQAVGSATRVTPSRPRRLSGPMTRGECHG